MRTTTSARVSPADRVSSVVWDPVRLDPEFRPPTVAVEIASDYREDSDLEDNGDAWGGGSEPE